jgi:hypothetical protein
MSTEIIQQPKIRHDGVPYFTNEQFNARGRLILVGNEDGKLVFVSPDKYRKQNKNTSHGT